jgi:hypothetical protein
MVSPPPCVGLRRDRGNGLLASGAELAPGAAQRLTDLFRAYGWGGVGASGATTLVLAGSSGTGGVSVGLEAGAAGVSVLVSDAGWHPTNARAATNVRAAYLIFI